MLHVRLTKELNRDQTAGLLEFCLAAGVDCFRVTALYSTGADRRKNERRVFQPLAPFSLGERRVELTSTRSYKEDGSPDWFQRSSAGDSNRD